MPEATMQRRAFLTLATVPAIAWPLVAKAQAFPAKPVTIVVPFSAGGPLDTLCRLLAGPMQGSLGQSVLIENVAGAGGTIGAARVARAAPDGYTIGAGNQGSHITAGALQPASFDLLQDFAPLAKIATNWQLILARKSMEATTLREFLDWLKAHPGATVGGGGYGTVAHTATLQFQQLSGTTLRFVPYRGAAPALQDLMAGQIDMMIDQPSNSLPQALAGKVKAYAIAAPARLAAAPDIPTADEAGLPGFQTQVWQALWLPRGTPDAVVERLNQAVRAGLADAAVRRRYADLGQEVPPPGEQTPQHLATLQKAEVETLLPLIKSAKLKTD
jgi:tripartite-type tricarboxylate transporter receptor subunit TctC